MQIYAGLGVLLSTGRVAVKIIKNKVVLIIIIK